MSISDYNHHQRRGADASYRRWLGAALRKRDENGGQHLHHRDCIHNLPPVEQVALRGRTVEWWTQVIGDLPEQITSADWQTEPPQWPTDA